MKKEINDEIEMASFDRILGKRIGAKRKPTVIVFAGIHGNEHAGIHALKMVFAKLDDADASFQGNFYALAGNLNALAKNIRYEHTDLNRIWSNNHILSLKESQNIKHEQKEQLELYQLIKEILDKDSGPFYFIDLHTTSSHTDPFITISDSINNRKFVSNFNVPIILGIEEFLEGPLLTYINEFGHVALGFEGGQHNLNESILNTEYFIWQVLEKTKCLTKQELEKIDKPSLATTFLNRSQDFYEIKFKYEIQQGEQFRMQNGYRNFDLIMKDQPLAENSNGIINANLSGRIFMPLYQDQGNDGFFIIGKLSKFWLHFSSVVRKLKMHNFLRVLPGISQDEYHAHTLIVDPKTARYLATKIFHLFGYRKKVLKGALWYFTKRDRKISPMI